LFRFPPGISRELMAQIEGHSWQGLPCAGGAPREEEDPWPHHSPGPGRPSRWTPGYSSRRFRALQQFFKWLADEEEIPDPMDRMKPPDVPEKPVPVFTSEELLRLERACAGRSFQHRRDAAMIAVLKGTGIRLMS